MGLFSSELSAKTMVAVCRQMATSFGAGIPILRILTLVSGNLNDSRARAVLQSMHDDIRKGSTLGHAARRQSRYLPRLFIELLSSGELGGRLDVTLKDLANYYEDRLEMRRSIVRMMAYPVFQLIAAWFLGTFALMLIRRLSFRTEAMSLGEYFRFYLRFQASAMLLFATGAVGTVILARMGLFRYIWGWVATYAWPIASVTRKFGLARFFRSFALMLGSGAPIKQAIESSAAVTANPYMEQDLLTAVPRVQSGVTLVEAFQPCRFLTPETREMLLVGEESGELEAALHKASEYQMDEARHAVTLAARVGGIAIGLAIATLVGYIVISFYARYFGMINELTR